MYSPFQNNQWLNVGLFLLEVGIGDLEFDSYRCERFSLLISIATKQVNTDIK